MITIDFQISFLAGVGFALAATPDLQGKSGDQWKMHAKKCRLSPGLLYQSLFLTPVIAYFMTRYADWEWHYLFDARRFFLSEATALSCALFSMILALTVLCHQTGFSLAYRLIHQGRRHSAVGLGFASALITVLVPLFFFNQATHVGIYADHHAGLAMPAWQNVEYLLTLAVAGLIVLPTYFVSVRQRGP